MGFPPRPAHWQFAGRVSDLDNQHLNVFEVILYKSAFLVSGLRHYWPFQLTDLVGHAVCVILLFECVRRRLGATVGFFVILPIVVLGSAWEDLLLPFNGQFIWSVAFFLGAVLLLDMQDRRADIAICFCCALRRLRRVRARGCRRRLGPLLIEP